MNVLILYNSTQTFTNTVYEHVASFGDHSSHRVFYTHADPVSVLNVDLDVFDAVGIHFSIRLPFDQVSPSVAQTLESFNGLKFLFIQDEYDFPQRVWYWIERLGINLVFTVVPEAGIETVYPKSKFPNTRFVTNLTGYVPEELPPTQELPRPSQRSLMVGYRGRPLPIRYGQLGVEKIAIGQLVQTYCDQHAIRNDIAWTEQARIYGPKWYEFVLSCRSMLGSESGSNVFDWDGTLNAVIERYRHENPRASDEDVYRDIVRPRELDGLMNQISPRVFEAIASRTILVLFEGEYSGVIRPGEHFIALKKDGSNLADVIQSLQNNEYIDAMADRAWTDVIESGKYSYKSFVSMVDKELQRSFSELECNAKRATPTSADVPTPITTRPTRAHAPQPVVTTPDVTVSGVESDGIAVSKMAAFDPTVITTRPTRANPPQPSTDTFHLTVFGSRSLTDLARRLLIYIWLKMPESISGALRGPIKRLLGKG